MKSQMNMMKLMEDFDTEKECRDYLEELRWPSGVRCPRCKGTAISRIKKRDQFDCDSCRYQFSVMSGTIFHDSHLPLPKWFVAVFLICESRKGISANQLRRVLDVSYKTAWFLCHRIRKAMKEGRRTKLRGVVEVDETYLGGHRRGAGTGRGTQNKPVVVGIRERGGDLRFVHVKDITAQTLAETVRRHVGANAEMVITDELPAYRRGLGPIYRHGHRRIKHKQTYVVGKIHTNTVESAFSLLKRGVVGTWHKISTKHLPAYLNEMTFRFNNRKNPFLFRDTIQRLIASPNLEYKKLTAA